MESAIELFRMMEAYLEDKASRAGVLVNYEFPLNIYLVATGKRLGTLNDQGLFSYPDEADNEDMIDRWDDTIGKKLEQDFYDFLEDLFLLYEKRTELYLRLTYDDNVPIVYNNLLLSKAGITFLLNEEHAVSQGLGTILSFASFYPEDRRKEGHIAFIAKYRGRHFYFMSYIWASEDNKEEVQRQLEKQLQNFRTVLHHIGATVTLEVREPIS